MSSSVTTTTNGVVVNTHVNPYGNGMGVAGVASTPHCLGQTVSSVLGGFRAGHPKALGTVNYPMGPEGAGSFTFYAKLPQNLENKRKALGEGEEKEEEGEEEKKTGKKKRKQKISESAKKEEQPSTSTQSTPSQKRKVQRPPIWSCGKSTRTARRWVTPVELPVTCGDKEGMLNRDKLAKGSCGKSTRTARRWVTPVELPVTCGDKEGMLNRDKLAKGGW
ncbi:hypothetical protein J4Q44_G00170880 [Coregonus suidteri]|uniref:SAND domain-containing protein n=1 Tax=Coregonus suidteri TaxID=861788 RepID=A0AAN8LL13_9TELE